MRNAGVGSGSTSWRTLLETGSVAGLSDGALLERFAAQREGAAEAAFAALVARHGPMVQTTCRRLLADPHDADDAFQATFLVLARKAGLIHQPERLAGWLYGTAYRVSRKLKVQSARRRRHESVAALTGDEASPDDDPGRREECRAVCEEVAHLPAAYRVVVVLHALEGLTQDEAARHLGCSDRTFRRRWVRSCNLLRRRLMQRGLAPAAATIASTLAPAPASAGITEAARDAVVDAAISFTAGTVPATASAVRLAQGVIQAMLWNKLKAGALAAGLVLAVGTGIGVRFVLPLASASGKDERPVAKAANADVPEPSPAEQYRALVKRHDDALKIYFDAVEGKTEAEEVEIADRLAPKEDDHVPAIVALAERYPDDPVAFDALLWAVDNTLGSGLEPGGRAARAVDRAMEILARDHAGDPRLGQFCFRMSYHLSPRNDSFLKTIAERSPNRVVRGQATVVLAESLKQEAMWIEIDRRPDAPESIAMVRALVRSEIVPDDATDQDVNDRVAKILQGIKTAMEEFAKEAPADGQQTVKVAGDPEALRRESDRLFARLLAEYGDVPYVRADGRPTRATLGEVAREGRKPGPTILRDDRRFRTIVKEIEAVRQQAYAAKEAAGDGEAGEKAFLAAVPKWADFGPKMWALAEDAPGSSAALDALLWIFGNAVSNKYGWFRDAREERSATLGKAVDILVRDYPAAMDTLICDNPFVPDNSRFELHISSACFEGPHLAPHADRLYQALYERARSRETRGRMGLTLALYLRKEAELGKLLANPSQVDPDYLTMFDPAFIEQVRRSEPRAITRQAEVILERVKGEYGDVRNRNAMGLRRETLGTLAGIELDDIRTLGIGQTAPEIQGEEADGTPMTLAEFRGKVVVLAFFHHEVCDCRAVFPRLRTMVEQFRGRPLVVLGVNNDRRDELKQLKAQGAITWRAWWDGDQPDLDGRGPITARWNPRTYNDFVLIDHRSAIRFRDLTPYNTRFDDTIESLVKQAEADAPGR